MDTSPTALFDSYEQDFQQFIDTIRQKLDGEGKEDSGGMCGAMVSAQYSVSAEQRKASLRRAEMELDEADEMVLSYISVWFVQCSTRN
jgi:vesicle transport through interaction with t-SNAREs protein 1